MLSRGSGSGSAFESSLAQTGFKDQPSSNQRTLVTTGGYIQLKPISKIVFRKAKTNTLKDQKFIKTNQKHQKDFKTPIFLV